MTESSPPRVLDVQGLNCPMPLLKAKKALNELPPEGLLKVLATDPGSVRDFEVFARQSGHSLLESREDGGVYTYLLRKKPAS
jgi:tRNA 2-thiouridine synthesizing protein A